MPTTNVFRQFDFSGGVQSSTSYLLRKRNEVLAAKNGIFNYKIGAVARRYGYEQVGYTLNYNQDALGFHAFKYGTNSKLLAALNSADGTQTQINVFDSDNYWKPLTLPVTLSPDSRINFLDSLNYSFIGGYSPSYGSYLPLMSIDSQLNVSTTKNVYAAPKARRIGLFQGKLYAINCQVNGISYPDRMYISSAPTGAFTFVQNPQQGLMQQLHVDSVRYIKPGMTLDIYSGGTFALQNTLTVIAVDKKNNNFSFAPTQVNLQDRDEVWVSGKKGTSDSLSYLWNTDYPTVDSADWIRIPQGSEENPEITAHEINSGRLMLFTRNGTYTWDGQNLTTISTQVGCVAHETVKTVSNWTIWLHSTGVWSYNVMFGQLRLLSRSVQNYIQAINQTNLPKASAGLSGRIYKVAVGQIGTLDASTTSTSTSSTSTSSTSSSTSSTSTSSTSISSTSSSSSISSTSSSISSTSSSTSSTSTSSTSSSISTSSTSSSTSTSSTTTTTTTNTRQILRLCYDFDLNIWWPEYHTREIRYQIGHTMSGYTKPYFMDDTGKVFRDETYNTDAGDLIPFEVETGRNNFGSEQVKNYIGAYIEIINARGALVYVSIDGKQYEQVGNITHDNQQLQFPGKLRTGRDISLKIVHVNAGDRPVFAGVSWYYSLLESRMSGSMGGIGG